MFHGAIQKNKSGTFMAHGVVHTKCTVKNTFLGNFLFQH